MLNIGLHYVSCTHAHASPYLIGDENGHERTGQFTSKEKAYTAWMKNALEKAERELGALGLVLAVGSLAKEISPHSIKKECEEKLATEPGGPPATSAFIRVGQNLNAVLKRYIRDDRYSDELCGRILAAYRTNGYNFGTLPPRENKEVFAQDYPDGIPYDEIIWGWKYIVEHYPRFAPVVIMGLWSVVYHHQFLVDNLPKDHSFFRSLYMTQGWYSLQKLGRPGGILVGQMYCPITKMEATGVPLYIKNGIEISELKSRVGGVQTIINGLCEKMNLLSVTTNSLVQKTDNLGSQIADLK